MLEPRLCLLTRYAVAIHPIAGVEQRTQELVVEPARQLSINLSYAPVPTPSVPSFPLDGAGRLRGDVVDDTIDAPHLVDDAGGGAGEEMKKS